MEKSYLRQVLVGICCVLVGGCASIIKGGGSQAIQLKSVPSGANCIVTDNVTGDNIASITTPNIVSLNKSRGYFKYSKYNVVCAMDNNLPQNGIIEGYANGWYIGGNLIFGGLIGYLIVDPATGAMWTLEPELISVNFEDPSKSILSKATYVDNTADTKNK